MLIGSLIAAIYASPCAMKQPAASYVLLSSRDLAATWSSEFITQLPIVDVFFRKFVCSGLAAILILVVVDPVHPCNDASAESFSG